MTYMPSTKALRRATASPLPKLKASGAAKSPRPAIARSTAKEVAPDEGYDEKMASGQRKTEVHATDAAGHSGGSLLDPALCLAADILDDLEQVRIANENRIRQLTRDEEDKDGLERGFGLDPDHPDVIGLYLIVHAIQKLENDATKNLQKKMRSHPLGRWVKARKGVGEKQAARLISAIGDPYWRPERILTDEDGNVLKVIPEGPRTVSQLWAYAGLHTIEHGDGTRSAARRQKGVKANWSGKIKMRAYLIAESCVKQLSSDCRDGHSTSAPQVATTATAQETGHGQGHSEPEDHGATALPVPCSCSPYRVAYDRRRAHTAVTQPDWTDGHRHNDALRIASKAILKDLWRAARDWHRSQVQEEVADPASVR
jgi:hypothetical protein